MSPFATLLLRDIKLAARSGGSAALALSFFALVATLVPLGVVPPFWPSVNSQTLPETAAANDVGLAAAALCAWSSVGKFSIRQ